LSRQKFHPNQKKPPTAHTGPRRLTGKTKKLSTRKPHRRAAGKLDEGERETQGRHGNVPCFAELESIVKKKPGAGKGPRDQGGREKRRYVPNHFPLPGKRTKMDEQGKRKKSERKEKKKKPRESKACITEKTGGKKKGGLHTPPGTWCPASGAPSMHLKLGPVIRVGTPVQSQHKGRAYFD